MLCNCATATSYGMRYIFFSILITVIGGAYFVLQSPNMNDFVINPALVGDEAPEESSERVEEPAPAGEPVKDDKVAGVVDTVLAIRGTEEDIILFDVPFTSQAPFGNWDNVVYQQACEESSVLMAMMWVQGKRGLSPQDANDSIQLLSTFEQNNYGEFRDASASDTAKLIKDYFSHDNIEVKSDIDANDIIAELESGNLVIAPVNGQKLGNPFYKPPGPLQHMLVIRGYDPNTREFITNDPGTRHGNGFRYGKDVLDAALQDYLTGYKEPITEINKRIIVIRPK